MKYILSLILGFYLVNGQSEEYLTFLNQLKPKIERAHYSASVNELKVLSAEAERLVAYDNSVWYGHYYSGYIYNLLANLFLSNDKENAERYLDLAEKRFESALKHFKSADVMALMSDMLGKKISLSPMKGIFLGPKSGRFISEALELEPENPTILITYARSKMFTPEMFGGNKELARSSLLKAIELNKTYQPKDSLLIDCRTADAFVWLGQLDLLEQKSKKAVENFEKALNIRNDYVFAKILKKQASE